MSKKYNIIYADPPWNKSFMVRTGDATDYYPTQSTEEISKLPVWNISKFDSVIFMWATDSQLQDALYTMRCWGFSYVTVVFTWVKRNPSGKDFFGAGQWTRKNPEMCLLGIRGNPRRISASVRQLVYSVRGKHSEKPSEIRDKIVELCGDIPRIELFARKKTKGWDVWGNEVESDIELNNE